MSLLDSRPKRNRDELYGRTRQLALMLRYIDDKEPLVIVSGLRRVGKTSLVKTALSTIENGIFIDAYRLGGSISRQEIEKLFKTGIQDFLNNRQSKKEQLVRYLISVEAISVGTSGVDIKFKRPQVTECSIIALFNALNEWGINNGETVVLAVDEAQEFARAADIDMGKIFSAFYSYENVVLILTGSEIGLLHDFVRRDEPDGAFYGRTRKELALDPLDYEESKGFLTKALSEAGIMIGASDALLDRAAGEIGGIIGWLVRFGQLCKENNAIRPELIERIQDEGSAQVKGEFDSFLDRNSLQRGKYEDLLHRLAGVNISYRSIEEYLKKKDLTACAQRLTDEGFLKTDEKGRYHFVDPLLAHAFRGRGSVLDPR